MFFRGVALGLCVQLGAFGALVAGWDRRHFAHVETPWLASGPPRVARFSGAQFRSISASWWTADGTICLRPAKPLPYVARLAICRSQFTRRAARLTGMQ